MSVGYSMLAPWCEKANIVGRAVEEQMPIGHHEILLIKTLGRIAYWGVLYNVFVP